MIASSIPKLQRNISIGYAKFWQYYYYSKNWLLALGFKYKAIITLAILASLLILSLLFYPEIKSRLTPYFSTDDRFEGLQTLLVSLGGAMVGATAIAFSLIMFAMQVNVERMPYGLFRKFSSDFKLLGSFAITFFLAVGLACLSLIPSNSWSTLVILGSAWCLVLIVFLLLFAYRRALSLISPTKQLAILVADTRKNLEIWRKAARRAEPLLKNQSQSYGENQESRTEYDTERNTYFLLNPSWTTVAQKSVSHSIAFARRYAEQGDHEVSAIALNAIVAINSAYILAKGKTFFSNNYLIDNPLSSDGFINNTLEHLRQNVKIGITRGDEQQIEQTFRAMLGLCQIYSDIDYSNKYATKSHAHLAASYLCNAVESVVPHNMPDVLMEGIRNMGTSALLILSKKEPEHITPIAEKIAVISCTGAVNDKHRPVTQTGVEQLAGITFELIRCDSHNVKHPLRDIRENIKLIAKIYLNTPDTSIVSIHSASLGAYYSGTVSTSFQNSLAMLVNAVLNAEENDQNAARIIDHIAQWSDGIYKTEKEILLLAIEKRSFLAFDVIHAIQNTTNILCALSNASSCNGHNSHVLKRHALWLISVLDWIPDEQDVISFIENYQVTEILFETAMETHHIGCDELATRIQTLLIKWAFKAGKYHTGWAILEHSCCGLACLNIIMEKDDDVLLQVIEERIAQDNSLELELMFRVSQALRKDADNFHREFPMRAIESAMGKVDQDRLRALLLRVADKLVPEEIAQED